MRRLSRLLVTLTAGTALVATGVVAGLAAGTGTVDPPPRIAFLANGLNPADALAAGPIAGRLGAPMFTTDPASLSDGAAAGLEDYDPELVIALGGPVALTHDVLLEVRDATGLALLPDNTTDEDEGVVRVFGESRFDTAQAVAELINAFSPGFLPVDATALEADTLDGLDSDDFRQYGTYDVVSRDFRGFFGQFENPDTPEIEGRPPTNVGDYSTVVRAQTGADYFGFVFQGLPFTFDVDASRPRVEILSLELCVRDTSELAGLSNLRLHVFERGAPSDERDVRTLEVDAEGDTCQVLTMDEPLVVGPDRDVTASVSIRPATVVDLQSLRWTLRDTSSDATPLTTARRLPPAPDDVPWDLAPATGGVPRS